MQTFQPNCTLPATSGFVKGPNIRGTLQIVWSCFAIILLCTWSIIVPNVPEQFKETPGTRFRSWLREVGKISYPGVIKVAWMLYTLVLTEYVLGKALSGFMRARGQATKGKEIIESGGDTAAESFQQQLKSWTFSHTMLADLGGFVVDFRELSLPTSQDQDENIVPVLDKPETDRQIQEEIDGGHPAVTESEELGTAGKSIAPTVDGTSQSSVGQSQPSQEIRDSNDEIPTQI